MERRSIKILKLLEAIQKKSTQSQRELAGTLNLSLGMVNKMIQDLTTQGALKKDNCEKNKVSYTLTPKGLTWKTNLKNQHLLHHIECYAETKRLVEQGLSQFMWLDESCCILFYGAGELCEIACMLSQENRFNNIKIIDDRQAGKTLNGFPVHEEAEMYKLPYDTILIMALKNTNQVRDRLIEKGIPADKIFQFVSLNKSGDQKACSQSANSDPNN